MGDPQPPPHVILFPVMAQGHFIPFLALGDRLLRRHSATAVTLVSTPQNIEHLRASLPSTAAPLRLAALPFSPTDHGLPAGTRSCADLPLHRFIDFFCASESLEPAFNRLVAAAAGDDRRTPVVVITDYFLGWTVDVARLHGAFHAVFITSGAYGIAVYFSLWTNLPHRRAALRESEFPLPEFPGIRIQRTQLPKHLLAADGADRWSLFLQKQIKLSYKTDAVIANTVEELEPTGIDMLRKLFASPIYAIGPLVRPLNKPAANSDHFAKWLSLHPKNSVLFVSFGSQNTITATQMMELAMGLERSGKAFIWVIRPPVGSDIEGEFMAEWLPKGFEQRMAAAKRGLVVHGWAPQVEILSHGSTGAFLSHCGWNSVLESLSSAVPIIGWPLTADQLYNSKVLEEDWGVGVEVARGNMESSKVEKERVERVIREVMGDSEKGREMRRRAEEARELMRRAWEGEEGSSVRGLEEFFKMAASNGGQQL